MALQVAFTVSIDTSGTAFDDGIRDEVARILRAAADAIQHGRGADAVPQGGAEGLCRDRYGRGVGTWRLLGIAE
ncbi:MAG: hypothetical protein QOK02_4579 [Mycobacterium sp.]|jgi:hypothetical protein|nr:hypothetical protein [Mycobacterium sp.]